MEDSQAQRLIAVLEALEGGIYITNRNYTVEFMNRAMVQDFGPGIGKKCHQVINHSDQMCPWCRAEEVFEKRETLHSELYIPTSDKIYDLTDIPLKNADGTLSKLAIYRDITERKRGEDKLWTTEADYRRLFENVGCGVYVSSKEGKFLNANQALLEMLGYESKEEFLKIDITRDLYLRPDERRQFQRMIERGGRVIDYAVDFKRKDGSRIPVLLTSHVRYDRLRNVSGYEGIIVDQSHRERLEEDYRRLFENVGCGVYTSTKEGKFLNANRALLEMLGYPHKAEFLKIDIACDLYVRPEDRLKFQEMIERDGQVIDYAVDFKRRDGNKLPVLLTSHVRYDRMGKVEGYEGIIVDQSQRKRMEQELKEANDFLNMIIRDSPNAIMAIDMEGGIILWNHAAEETLGYRAQDVVGKMNIQKIYPEGMAQKVMKMMRSPSYGGPGRLTAYPMVYVRQDGRIVEGNLSASIITDANGNEIASVGIFVDLKERLEMERKLRQTQEQLLNSEKLAAMGRLTSQIAHELNNPLYGIMNTLELLKTEISQQSKRRRVLEMALSETVRLSDLLKKMLSFSKPDQEMRQVANINTIIDEILILHEKQLRENDIKIVANFSEPAGYVHASINQLRQVFLNMVSNARDAMPDGGTLSVTTRRGENNVLIDLEDTGVGIRPENLTRIFDAFFTTKDAVKGVGLGLSVCYGFIKDHGGDITVESTPDAGTKFTIALPLCKEAPVVDK
ncbi:MAG: PAS domain S-box protein [Desulfobacteraceae bacterium]|nr:MAG: PAS domain S-box protein [Desulfobacteraceae bacterium]